MTSKTYSGVWNYFRVMENDASKAQCTLCDKVLSRGRSDRPKDFSTSSLLTHLRSQHRRDYNELTVALVLFYVELNSEIWPDLEN